MDRKVYIFRETINRIPTLAERGTALKRNGTITQQLFIKEQAKDLCDPNIFF
jgi:hypothetical protein